MILVLLMGMVPYIEFLSVFRNIKARKLYLEELENAIYMSWAESQDVMHEMAKLRKILLSKSDGASRNIGDSVNESRLKNLHQVCHQERNSLSLNHQFYGIGSLKKEWLNHLIYDKKHKMLFCYIPGVASINFRRVLIQNKAGMLFPEKSNFKDFYDIPEDFVKDPTTFRLLSTFSKKEIIKILYDRQVFRFMFVRDPFARLVSSYRSKFQNNNNNTDSLFTQLYTHHIKMLYQEETKEEEAKKELKHIDENEYLVTFQAFAKYLTHHKTIQHNEHWDQYHDLCFPCYIKYNFIGRLEQIDTESVTIQKKLNPDAKIGNSTLFPDLYAEPNLNDSLTDQVTVDRALRHLLHLDNTLIRELYDVYRVNFLIIRDFDN